MLADLVEAVLSFFFGWLVNRDKKKSPEKQAEDSATSENDNRKLPDDQK
jgi:hypothetical protein